MNKLSTEELKHLFEMSTMFIALSLHPDLKSLIGTVGLVMNDYRRTVSKLEKILDE